MIKGLQLFVLFRKASGVSSYSGIHTDSVLFGGFRRRVIRLPDEPGIRLRRKILLDSDYDNEITDEFELEDDLDMKKIEQLYAKGVREDKKHKEKVQLKITANKFFKAKPQPLMLTYNERLCIQYLHKQDPVQWDFKTLSESFPATPDTIQKIIKSKRKITPERAQKMDSVVQKNWQLLSEDKLNADPHVLEHLKKFVNRREVLLEQIKNETFYLPEVKDEPVWNQGEMKSILVQYEETIKKLAGENSPKALNDTSSNEKEGEKSNLDLLNKQIKAQAEKIPKTKDSFRFGDVINAHRKQTTLEELEDNILKKANRGENLELPEKVILDNKLGVKKEGSKNIESSTPPPTQEVSKSLKAKKKVNRKSNKVVNLESFEEVEAEELSVMLDYTPPDENTYSGHEANVSKILNEIKTKPKIKEKPVVVKEKKKIDFSDPERLEKEKTYYDNEVLTIKNTAFWDNKKSSREKALAEAFKADLDGPTVDESWKKIFVLDPDPYPERIKIPKNKQGSGLTFRVKDCYYDDDGEFLYRVPGMTK